MEDDILLYQEGIQSIRKFVEQCFIGNYVAVSAEMDRIVEKVTAMSNEVIRLIGSDNDDFRLMQLLLTNTVVSLEANDMYKMCDSLLQLSDFYEVVSRQPALLPAKN